MLSRASDAPARYYTFDHMWPAHQLPTVEDVRCRPNAPKLTIAPLCHDEDSSLILGEILRLAGACDPPSAAARVSDTSKICTSMRLRILIIPVHEHATIWWLHNIVLSGQLIFDDMCSLPGNRGSFTELSASEKKLSLSQGKALSSIR